MQENKKINYGKATYSLAMIEFNEYVDLLKEMDKRLLESTDTFNLIICKTKKSKIYSEVLNEYVLPVFCKEKDFITSVKTSIEKYKTKLKTYLTENPTEFDCFNAKLIELNLLLKDKEKMVNKYIDRMFEYNQSVCENISF